MSFLAIIIGLLVLLGFGTAFAVRATRRRRASMHRTPHGRVHPESLLADLDDAMGRTEQSARDWRQQHAHE